MQTIDQLNQKYAIEGAAKFEAGKGGMPRLAVTTAGGSVHVYLHGAHLTHYQPAGQADVMFLASKAFFEPGKAIRGGIPICWPWFGPRDIDKNQMHGFVRTRPWDVESIERVGDGVRSVFTLASSIETRAIWNHDFALRFVVTVDRQLTTALEVKNTGSAEFRHEDALHTYFNVADVRQIAIDGLTGTTFIDKVGPGPERKVDEAKPLRITGQTDRVYLNTPATCVINDPVLKRRIVIEKENSLSTVVWNPWLDRGGSFADMSLEEWPKFVCIESCNARDNTMTLGAGETHVLTVRIRSEAM